MKIFSRNSPSFFTIPIILLLIALVVVLVLQQHERNRVDFFRNKSETWQEKAILLQAKVEGLEEANLQLHKRIRSSSDLPAEQAPLPDENQSNLEPKEFPQASRYDEQVVETPLPEVSPTDKTPDPPIVSGPPSELVKMMAQFPELDLKTPENQPNTIEEILRANPELRIPEGEPTSRYGPGIDSLVKENPDLAEQLEKTENE